MTFAHGGMQQKPRQYKQLSQRAADVDKWYGAVYELTNGEKFLFAKRPLTVAHVILKHNMHNN